MDRADFYIGLGDKATWIGSCENGDIHKLPVMLFFQPDWVEFMKVTLDYLMTKKDAYIPFRGDEWPWMWADSRMTTHSYYYDIHRNRILYCYVGDENYYDACRIIDGEELTTLGKANHPLMMTTDIVKEGEIVKVYGRYPSKAV